MVPEGRFELPTRGFSSHKKTLIKQIVSNKPGEIEGQQYQQVSKASANHILGLAGSFIAIFGGASGMEVHHA